jgi:predicted phosphodiesterase
MRIGLLSDVHANHAALQAAVSALRDRGIDRLLVAGDLVGYGPHPNECIATLVDAEAECVLGNHDLFVLDRLPPTRFPPMALRSAEVTKRILSPDALAFLGGLPQARRAGPVFMTHGSPDDPEEYVNDPARAEELLGRLEHLAPGADTLVLGHTHRQWCVVAGQGTLAAQSKLPLPPAASLINPGSVGQSRQREMLPRSRCAVYDTVDRQVEFLSVDYDVEATATALRQLGLPYRCLHLRPSLSRRVARRTRRAADRHRRPN